MFLLGVVMFELQRRFGRLDSWTTVYEFRCVESARYAARQRLELGFEGWAYRIAYKGQYVSIYTDI